ncbi:hypothetical protein [Rhizobium lusitanum]|uniref:Uncharacterized protein n=1 Tax=Rhizobium lusitanum TaxID=293958 RepID=A0A1C3VSB0_9HYPH|nr:hypothetical protein [Rhizobium lusitanum]SCB30465.1 hypothetical protein GA0061101_106112 [Rhizobium lusitanum]
MTFSSAFTLFGPDTIAISEALNIPEHEADHLINTEMNRLYAEKAEEARAYQREYNLRTRARLREIRAGRQA